MSSSQPPRLEELSIDIDKLYVDIYHYFNHSMKRHQEFYDLWQSLFSSDPGTIMKHCPKLRLSFRKRVDNYLKQLPGFITYFCSCNEQNGKMISITMRHQYPFNEPILHFAWIFSMDFSKSPLKTPP